MKTRWRVAFIVFAPGLALVACNALTGIGDYAVEGAPLADGSAADVLDASAIPDVLAARDATDGCAIFENPPIDAAGCTDPSVVGPAMAQYTNDAGAHCIDVTEVTVDQYQEFVDARRENMCGQPDECTWNTTYSLGSAGLAPNSAQASVDWCDAFMYCRYAGKHLCGSMSAPASPAGNVLGMPQRNEEIDLWYNFCTAGGGANGAFDYFYGDHYVAGTCVDDTFTADAGDGGPQPVKSAFYCHGGGIATDVYDMVGNVAEWEWSCTDGGASAFCSVRGGDWLDSVSASLSCDRIAAVRRDATSNEIGFRCCAD